MCATAATTVVSGDEHDPKTTVRNLLSRAEKELVGNFWLAPTRKQASFILNLGCKMNVKGVKLVNTHNRQFRDRSTKQFK